MYLSNRDIKWAIECGKLIVDPRPNSYDETSIDLHLGAVEKDARIWDLRSLSDSDIARGATRSGQPPEIHLGDFEYRAMAAAHLKGIPEGSTDEEGKNRLVYKRGDDVIVRPFGFLLWTTREKVGTPEIEPGSLETQRYPELICFVNAKSTKARTGLIVHFTAPTIHAGWSGNITLEIANLGPFTLVLKEGDALAQLTVATISSAPDMDLKAGSSQTQGQVDPSGAPRPSS